MECCVPVSAQPGGGAMADSALTLLQDGLCGGVFPSALCSEYPRGSSEIVF